MVAKKARVVIVGAGMAGLTAANKLYTSSSELFDLCVVEAGDRIGGRIRSSEFSGVRVETGATWIHGISGSPVYDIACKIHALDSPQPWECMDDLPSDPVSVAEGGLRVDPTLAGPISSLYRGLMDFAKSESAPPVAAAAKDPSVGSFLRRGLHAYRAARDGGSRVLGGGWELQSAEDAAFAMHENTERTYTSADDLNQLDLAAESEYREFPGEEITIAKGYSRIIEHLASALPPGLIRMGKKVERIEWRPRGSPPNDSGDPPVRLHFEDRSIVEADHVIVTVSLGVLKADVRKDSGLFSPSLPSFKREAIGRLGFGVVNKLFMELDCCGGSPFPFLQLLFDQDPLSQRRVASIPPWIRRTAYIRPVYGDSHVLIAWFAGKEALELESLKDDEILCGVQATLEGFSCSAGAQSPHGYGKITKVMKSGWGRNPLFLGSYSYVAVGSGGEDLDFMAEPLPRTTGGASGVPPLQILFAGEATHRTHYSTTHGAYLSGIREAQRLLQHYSC